MICCIDCFKDTEIKSIILSLNNTGSCEVCGSKETYTYDTDRDNSLVDIFDGLIDVYTSIDSLPEEYPRGKTKLLNEALYSDWNIFNINKEKIYDLVKNLCKEKYDEHPEIFDGSVGIAELVQAEYLKENSLLGVYSWEDFVNAIKTENRFHTNYVNTIVLNLFCEYVRIRYKKGTKFYRARISKTKGGFSINKMGAPPKNIATAGRANPDGISYLYLSNNLETTLREIRAGLYDYVAVGTFELLEDIEMVNFTLLDKVSPFLDSDSNYTRHAINKEHLNKICRDIAKPLRRADSVLDYLPTQYITDFIKSKRYDGIEYKSTLCKNGRNFSIFNEKLLECKEVSVYDVTNLNYVFEPIEV